MISRRWKKAAWWAGGIGLVSIVLILLTDWPTNFLMIPLTLHEQPRPSDVIIVLGAGARKNPPHVPPQAQSRVLEGVLLRKQGYADYIIVSGGYHRHSRLVEAPLMKEYALEQGELSRDVILEARSVDTRANAEFSLAIMAKRNWRTALVVTSPYHTWRACRIFRKLQADVRCIVAPFSLVHMDTVFERLVNLRSVVREYGAIIYGWYRGYL